MKFIVEGVFIPPYSKTEIYQEFLMCFDDILESYFSYKFLGVDDFNLSKANWIYDQNKSAVLFRWDTTSQNRNSSNF